MKPLRHLSPLWQVQRRRRPALTDPVDAAVLAVRSRGDLLAEVSALRTRVAELERDHRLMAASLATLTERLAAGATSGGGPVVRDADDEGRHRRAQLAAIAFYEERIGRLEELADRGRRGEQR